MAVVDVGIVINARDNATATIGRVRTAINQLNGSGGASGGTGLRGMAGGFLSAGRNIQGFLSRMNTAAAAVFVVYHSVRTLAFGFAEFGAQVQQSAISLTLVTGSFQGAQEQIARINQEMVPLGVSTTTAARGIAQLAAAGIDLERANETIRATATAVMAFGGTEAQMDRAITALVQMASKGTVAMEELRGQLSEAVPIALVVMANRAGVSVREFTERVRRGMVDAETAIEDFSDGINEMFEGFDEAISQTLPGAVARLSGVFEKGFSEVFARTTIDEQLVAIVNGVTDSIQAFFDSITQEDVDAFNDAMRQMGDIMESVRGAVDALSPVFGFLKDALGPILPVLGELLRVLGDFVALILSGALFAIFKLAEAYARLAGDAAGAEAAMRAANEAGQNIERAVGRLGGEGRGSSGLSRLEQLEQLSARTKLEDTAQALAEAQRVAAELRRDQEQATREQLRMQERLRDLVAETNAQYAGSLLNFADNLDRIANRVADIFDLESLTYDVRLASADALAGMTTEQVRQAELARAQASGLSGQLATIQANAVAVFTRSAQTFRNEMADALDEIRIAHADAFSDITGGDVEAAALRVDLQYRRQLRTLEEQLESARQLHERTGAEEQTLREIEALLARSNELRAQAVEHARQMAEAARAEALARIRIATTELELQARQAARANSDSPLVQGGLGTQAGAMIERVEQERQRLFAAITEMEARLVELRAKASFADPATAAALNEQIEATVRMIQVQTDAMGRLSEAAVMSKQLWQEVGRTIEEGVGNAIYGVITGTQTLEDVGLQMYQALTRAAIDYIVQLIMIQILKAATGFADGGVVGGPVKKMASGGTVMGGIIRGPTTFLAGEAGEEAIMPLERVGGKLGVRAVGSGGGDSYNITIQAIDTQTGMDFLMKNRAHIVGALQRQMMLGRGIDKMRP